MLMVLTMFTSVYAACPADMVSYWDFEDIYDDDFSSGLNSDLWTLTTDSGASITPLNGKMRMSYSGTSTSGDAV